jgi:hypothetical protein
MKEKEKPFLKLFKNVRISEIIKGLTGKTGINLYNHLK